MNDPNRFFQKRGAIEAALEARKAGKIRVVNFTDHKDPAILLHMLDVAEKHDFRLDTIQMPLNVMAAHYHSFGQQVLPVLVREKMGILGMKSKGSGDILKSRTVTPVECLHYALSLHPSVVINGIDSTKLLDQAFEAAATFHPLNEREMVVLLAKTKDAAGSGDRRQI